MQKYIAVVNHRMDDDEISKLIAKGIAGALFEISRQNYSWAAELIKHIKDLSRKYNRPISIIQDTSRMQDPLDLEFGLKSGVNWVATDKLEHAKLVKGLDKLASVIYKGRDLPKGVRVDSVMSSGFVDPDASVIGSNLQIRHIGSEHEHQKILDSILDFSDHAGAHSIAVSDLDLAKNLSWRRSRKKIFFAPTNENQAPKGAILWGVQPTFGGKNWRSNLRNSDAVKKGDRVVDATNVKHVEIHLVP